MKSLHHVQSVKTMENKKDNSIKATTTKKKYLHLAFINMSNVQHYTQSTFDGQMWGWTHQIKVPKMKMNQTERGLICSFEDENMASFSREQCKYW